MGTFSGRALAGASGNANAKIYCSNAQPELVSIANVSKFRFYIF